MIHIHQTAPTQFVEANGIRFAYRRFGKPDGVPLVFNQHFTGTMDHWDPAVTDGLAILSADGRAVAALTGCPGDPVAFAWTGARLAAATNQGRLCAWQAP